jgi:hypothetical protein
MSLWCLLLFAGALRNANADFIGPYAINTFAVTNINANGFDDSPDIATLVLTGPNNGSGYPGTTDFTTVAAYGGWFRFHWAYASRDDPSYDDAGYLVASDFIFLSDSSGDFGDAAFTLAAGETFGFRLESVDNQNEPGVLTITQFEAPVPEPGSGALVFVPVAFAVTTLVWRRHGSRRRSAVRVLGGMMCIGLRLFGQGQVFYSGSNVTGQVVLTSVVNLRQQSQSFTFAALKSGGETLPKVTPTRLRPPMHKSLTASPLTAATPALQALTILSSAAGTGFNALSHLDQRQANNGNQFSIEPPSGNIAVANGYVLEGVNDAVQVYDVSGSPKLSRVLSSNQLFGLAPAINRSNGVNGPYLTDMRVYYDQNITRWVVLERAQDNDASGTSLATSHLYIAVSKTADPTGDYNVYTMETTNGSHPGCPCIADYPQIGSDQYGLHIAWNEFNSMGLFFVDAAVLSLSKASLASNAANPTAIEFLIPFTTGYEFALQPASTPPGASNFLASGGLEYFVSSLAAFSSGSQVALWAVYNTSSLATSTPNLTLTRIITPTLNYTYPDVATQRPGPLPYGSSLTPPGTLAYLDGGDTRVQLLSYASGRLFFTLPTAVPDASGRWVVGAAYVILSPSYRNNVLGASVLNQGYLFVNGNHVLRPAIAVNAQGRGAIAVTLVGNDWYPTAAFVPIDTFSTPATLQTAGLGALPEDGFTGYPGGGAVGLARWGDYNSAVATSDGAIWLLAEYIGNYPRTDYANWNTYIVRMQP